jgi:serine protease Do
VDIIRGKKKKTLRVSLTELPNDGNILASAKIDNSNWLGLGVENINEENSQRFKLNIVDGVVVVELKLNSAASRSGIRRGDVIVRVGDNEIENISDFRRAMDGSELQNTILFLVKRKNTSLFFTVNKD